MSGTETVRRAGLMIPSSNTTIEHEYPRFGAPEISWHYARLDMTQVSAEGIEAQEREIEREAEKLGAAQPALILACQSAIGFLRGAGYERALAARIAAHAACPAFGGAQAMALALAALGVRRVALATPYTSDIDRAVAAYLDGFGIGTVGAASLGMVTNFDIAAIGADDLVALVRQADRPEAEAVFMPGGNTRLLAILPRLEAAIGKPVVTTNQAAIWMIEGMLGVVRDGAALGALGRCDPDGAVRRAASRG